MSHTVRRVISKQSLEGTSPALSGQKLATTIKANNRSAHVGQLSNNDTRDPKTSQLGCVPTVQVWIPVWRWMLESQERRPRLDTSPNNVLDVWSAIEDCLKMARGGGVAHYVKRTARVSIIRC